MPENQVDLSKLKINRSEPVPTSSQGGGKRWILLGAGVIILCVIAAFFWFRSSSVTEVEAFTVLLVSPSQQNTLLTSSGYVVAQRKAAIASKATGRIVELGFKEGDKVRKGQIIARIESADVEAALAQARADYFIARADSIDATQSLSRTKSLFDRQLVSQADYDAAKATYDRVVATIASRVASVHAAEVQVENTNIRAPFDGTILTKNADVGEVVAPFGAGASSKVAVVTIADMGSCEVEADVSESNIERIQVGQPCEITLDAYPDTRYRGVVDKIVPTADRAKATVMTKIRFIEQDRKVLPEMSAKVHFLSPQSHQEVNNQNTAGEKPFLAVDKKAIVTRNERTSVFVIRDGRAEERPVTTGRRTGDLTEVVTGVSAGDQVILHPAESISSGSKVTIKAQ
jgi:HlyD family secretion protein